MKKLIVVQLSHPFSTVDQVGYMLGRDTLILSPKSMVPYLSDRAPQCKIVTPHELRKTADKLHLYKNINRIFVFGPPPSSGSATLRSIGALARKGNKSIILTSNEIHNESHYLSIGRLAKSHDLEVVDVTGNKLPDRCLKLFDIVRAVKAKLAAKIFVFNSAK